MKLHTVAHFFHHLAYKHRLLVKEGVGEFSTCELRGPFGKVDVQFRPDFKGAAWWRVPAAYDEEGTLLFTRISRADNAWHAMSILRAEYAEMGRFV